MKSAYAMWLEAMYSANEIDELTLCELFELQDKYES